MISVSDALLCHNLVFLAKRMDSFFNKRLKRIPDVTTFNILKLLSKVRCSHFKNVQAVQQYFKLAHIRILRILF